MCLDFGIFQGQELGKLPLVIRFDTNEKSQLKYLRFEGSSLDLICSMCGITKKEMYEEAADFLRKNTPLMQRVRIKDESKKLPSIHLPDLSLLLAAEEFCELLFGKGSTNKIHQEENPPSPNITCKICGKEDPYHISLLCQDCRDIEQCVVWNQDDLIQQLN